MAMVSCPKCSHQTKQSFYPTWVLVAALVLFPVGLLAFFAGRKPTSCENCGHTWNGKDRSATSTRPSGHLAQETRSIAPRFFGILMSVLALFTSLYVTRTGLPFIKSHKGNVSISVSNLSVDHKIDNKKRIKAMNAVINIKNVGSTPFDSVDIKCTVKESGAITNGKPDFFVYEREITLGPIPANSQQSFPVVMGESFDSAVQGYGASNDWGCSCVLSKVKGK
ncbi:DUF2367 domain-containing protein [Geomonas limicola]|uniref:DUF2367 domain-containing protein n=1 Tax=Geomonas limicola TaxID=2740186 RepID=UPI001610C72A|nr:DUF2367 domain-containing protein [Geomonas limicola]